MMMQAKTFFSIVCRRNAFLKKSTQNRPKTIVWVPIIKGILPGKNAREGSEDEDFRVLIADGRKAVANVASSVHVFESLPKPRKDVP